MPTVQCQWGCSEIIHKVGYLSLDIIFQYYLQKYFIHIISNNNLYLDEFVTSARDDYIPDIGNETIYLFNPR